RANAAVFTTQTYDQISISGGTAGDAQAQALALFSALDVNDLANVAASDLAFVNSVHTIANDAETEAFNVAIKAATGDAKTALQNGKIQNKVLKLTAAVLALQIQDAQGKDTTAKQATEQKKLDNNIALDKAAAGQAATKVAFTAS
ncbi:hypothetical protein HYPSUDRAFT_107460, partial [Hypholoma sublateritium FD-334 SS-4]